MANDHVYYINIKPYVYDLPIDEMVSRFSNTEMKDKLKRQFSDYKYIPKEPEDLDMDVILGKSIMSHLKLFFSKNNANNSATVKRSTRNKRGKTHKTIV
jgi:hypothetical protein